MNIQITSRKFRAKESLKDFTKKELKSLEKFNGDILDANVILSYTHLKDSKKTAEMVVQIPGKVFKAAATTDEFRKSIRTCTEKLTRQLKNHKEKQRVKVK